MMYQLVERCWGTVRVLIHATGYFSRDDRQLTVGYCMSGVTTAVTGLIDQLLRLGHSVHLVSPELSAGPQSSCATAPDLRVSTYDASFPDLLERKGAFKRTLARHWYSTVADDRHNPVYNTIEHVLLCALETTAPDIINVHNLNAAVAWVRLKETRSIAAPLVVSVHDIVPDQVRFIAARLDHVAAIVCASQSVHTRLARLGIPSRLLAVVRPGIDADLFRAPLANSGSSPSALDISSHDRLNAVKGLIPTRRVPEKGIENAVAGFSRYCNQRRQEGILFITGAGSSTPAYDARLREVVERNSAGPLRVLLLPYISYAEMAGLYQSVDVTLTMSKSNEGLGLANLEAMVAGRSTVISSGTGGTRDYVRPGWNALVCDPDDSVGIADAIEFAQRERSRSLIEHATQTGVFFTSDEMARGYLAIFRRLMKISGSGA